MRQFCTTERTSACRFGQRPALLFLGDLNSESAASQTMDSEHTSSVVDRRLLLKSCLLRQGRTLAQLHSCKAVFFALLVCCKTPHCGIADQLEKRYGQSATNCRAEVTIIGFLPLRDSVCVCASIQLSAKALSVRPTDDRQRFRCAPRLGQVCPIPLAARKLPLAV